MINDFFLSHKLVLDVHFCAILLILPKLLNTAKDEDLVTPPVLIVNLTTRFVQGILTLRAALCKMYLSELEADPGSIFTHLAGKRNSSEESVF